MLDNIQSSILLPKTIADGNFFPSGKPICSFAVTDLLLIIIFQDIDILIPVLPFLSKDEVRIIHNFFLLVNPSYLTL